jgi:hypothetical protein
MKHLTDPSACYVSIARGPQLVESRGGVFEGIQSNSKPRSLRASLLQVDAGGFMCVCVFGVSEANMLRMYMMTFLFCIEYEMNACMYTHPHQDTPWCRCPSPHTPLIPSPAYPSQRQPSAKCPAGWLRGGG